MNKFIKEQLNKTKILLPKFDDNTTNIFIPKSNNIVSSSDLLLGHCYLLYLEDYIVHEPAGFSLSANWNNGTTPNENKVKAKVMQDMGKMVRLYTMGN